MLYKYTLSLPEKETLVQHLSISPLPDWDDFEDFARQFIDEQGGDLVTFEYGMDRHQIDYEVQQLRFRLHFEHYTQSVWIEPLK